MVDWPSIGQVLLTRVKEIAEWDIETMGEKNAKKDRKCRKGKGGGERASVCGIMVLHVHKVAI